MIDARKLQRRARSLREPPQQQAKDPVRREVLAGTIEVWCVIRSVDLETGTMMVQAIRYRTPGDPQEGDVEAYGAEFRAYPMLSYRYDQYEFAVYPEEDDAAEPLGVRVYPMRCVLVGGSWLVDVPLSMKAGIERVDPSDPISPASGTS